MDSEDIRTNERRMNGWMDERRMDGDGDGEDDLNIVIKWYDKH